MNNQTFLACSGQDFKRATYRADAGWTVSQLAADHPIACLAADPVAAGRPRRPHREVAGRQSA